MDIQVFTRFLFDIPFDRHSWIGLLLLNKRNNQYVKIIFNQRIKLEYVILGLYLYKKNYHILNGFSLFLPDDWFIWEDKKNDGVGKITFSCLEDCSCNTRIRCLICRKTKNMTIFNHIDCWLSNRSKISFRYYYKIWVIDSDYRSFREYNYD